nr:hypothetical protein [Tanacetum cinerariifolium]
AAHDGVALELWKPLHPATVYDLPASESGADTTDRRRLLGANGR